MSERQAVLLVLWALGTMIIIGALLPALLPGLIRFVDRAILKEPDSGGH
ncbi:MAG: hypothetical protein QN168_00315 [Armatimonadota bacterium]|nr:hypothetical protein [Armatimonadota bacterium]